MNEQFQLSDSLIRDVEESGLGVGKGGRIFAYSLRPKDITNEIMDLLIRRRYVVATAAPCFQSLVNQWMQKCFGPAISADTVERNHRFLEESLELVQACGCTKSEAHQLVEYVFNRPVGEKDQEAGGVRVTLSALCSANGINEDVEAYRELRRINWPEVMAKIRTKQALKPKHSPLPQTVYIADGEGSGDPA
jgi:hypothetical protein